MYIFCQIFLTNFSLKENKTNKMFSYTNYIRAVEQTYREIIWFDISLFSEVNKFDVTAETFSIRENVFTFAWQRTYCNQITLTNSEKSTHSDICVQTNTSAIII